MYVLDAEIMLSVVAIVSPLIAYFHTFGGASMVRTPSEGWGMSENYGTPEARQLPRFWTRGRRETESRQRVSDVKSP